MKLKAYSVYDVKAEVYNPPYVMKTEGLAIRTFAQMANDPQSAICQYPEDYVLFQVGEWDDSIGFFETTKAPKKIGTGLQYKKKENVNENE